MTNEAPPKPFEHCSTVFEAMKKQAKPQVIEGEHALVYEGFLTQLFAKLGLAIPYYTKIMNYLKAMGCVQQLSRGGGNSPSRWALIEEPTWDKFEAVDDSRSKSQTKLGQTADMTKNLARRVDALEQIVGALVEKEVS